MLFLCMFSCRLYTSYFELKSNVAYLNLKTDVIGQRVLCVHWTHCIVACESCCTVNMITILVKVFKHTFVNILCFLCLFCLASNSLLMWRSTRWQWLNNARLSLVWLVETNLWKALWSGHDEASHNAGQITENDENSS